jgi:hypothetical protein
MESYGILTYHINIYSRQADGMKNSYIVVFHVSTLWVVVDEVVVATTTTNTTTNIRSSTTRSSTTTQSEETPYNNHSTTICLTRARD